MARFVGIRFNDEEDELLTRAMAAYGHDQISSHVKRVYFDALKPNLESLNEIRDSLERIESLMSGLQSQGSNQVGGVDANMLLSVVCGTYLMIRKSVNESIRAQSDRLLDHAAIEAFLRGN
jgi:hypothetical protein